MRRPTTPSIDLDALYVAIDRQRRGRRIQWRVVAAEADVVPSLLTRLAQGHSMDAHNLARLLLWLGTTDLAPYLLPMGISRSFLPLATGGQAKFREECQERTRMDGQK